MVDDTSFQQREALYYVPLSSGKLPRFSSFYSSSNYDRKSSTGVGDDGCTATAHYTKSDDCRFLVPLLVDCPGRVRPERPERPEKVAVEKLPSKSYELSTKDVY